MKETQNLKHCVLFQDLAANCFYRVFLTNVLSLPYSGSWMNHIRIASWLSWTFLNFTSWVNMHVFSSRLKKWFFFSHKFGETWKKPNNAERMLKLWSLEFPQLFFICRPILMLWKLIWTLKSPVSFSVYRMSWYTQTVYKTSLHLELSDNSWHILPDWNDLCRELNYLDFFFLNNFENGI